MSKEHQKITEAESKEDQLEDRRAYQRNYYLANKDKAKEYQRLYHQLHRPPTGGTKHTSESELEEQERARAVTPKLSCKSLTDLSSIEKFAETINEHLADKNPPPKRDV